MSRGWRNVCFTYWIPDEEVRDLSWRLLDMSLWPDVAYAIYSLEDGKNPGGERSGLHFQGYIEFIGQKRITWMHENLEGISGAHFEQRRGTQDQARAYCMKDDTHVEGPWEVGEMRVQGKRNDLVDIKRKIDEMQPVNDLYDEHFSSMIRYKRQFVEYKRIRTPKRDFKTQCWLFVGPPGHGKSTMMTILARMLGRVYFQPFKKGSGLYFDDYDGEDVMIIDEFDGDVMPPKFFNYIADEHPAVLPVHGGAGHQMVSKYLFIGSNYTPRMWWKKRNASQLRQTTRRIDVVFKFGFKYASPLEPVYGGQDPAVPLDGFSSYSSNLVREEEIPFWVSHPETMSNMGVVLRDPQPKITEFLSEK